ncbi:MAG: ketosteroid isomerase-related protein [Hyphomicrobiaceae bacterium]
MAAAKTQALITAYYDAFNRGDVDGMLSCVADDIIHDTNQGDRRLGRDRFHAFCARMAHHYQERLEDIVVMATADGSRAAAEFNVHGKYLVTETGLPDATGQVYRLPAGTFFAVRDGKIARVTTYYNLTDWIMQVSAAG